MARVVHVTRGDGVIALIKIRQVHLRRKVDFGAGIKPVDLCAETIEHVIRRGRQLDVESFAQDFDEKILLLIVARAEVAKVEINFFPIHAWAWINYFDSFGESF
jgi:hypothetical protein